MLLVDDHTLQAPTEKQRFDKFKQISCTSIVEPLFLDDELAKASLVGPAVVGRDGRVAGTLFYSHIVQKLKFK